MGDHVYLTSDLGETWLGTVAEIRDSVNPRYNPGGPGQSFLATLSDIVDNLITAQDGDCATFKIEIR